MIKNIATGYNRIPYVIETSTLLRAKNPIPIDNTYFSLRHHKKKSSSHDPLFLEDTWNRLNVQYFGFLP